MPARSPGSPARSYPSASCTRAAYTEDGNWDLVGNSATGRSTSGCSGTCTCARTSRARVGEGIAISLDEVKDLPPLDTQTLTDEEEQRRRNLDNNGPHDVDGHVMTHCVSNERVAAADERDFAEVLAVVTPAPLPRGRRARRRLIGAT